jgi:predicted amidophosphoribosyltransferase
MKCTNCGAELAPADAFCAECGAPRLRAPTPFETIAQQFAVLKARYDAKGLSEAALESAYQDASGPPIGGNSQVPRVRCQ